MPIMSVTLKWNFISSNILDDNMYAKLERGKKENVQKKIG